MDIWCVLGVYLGYATNWRLEAIMAGTERETVPKDSFTFNKHLSLEDMYVRFTGEYRYL